MSLALELISPGGKLFSVYRLVSVMAFQQYCYMPWRLYQTLKYVDVSTAVYINKSQVATRVDQYSATIGCAAGKLLDETGLVTSRAVIGQLAWASRSIYRSLILISVVILPA